MIHDNIAIIDNDKYAINITIDYDIYTNDHLYRELIDDVIDHCATLEAKCMHLDRDIHRANMRKRLEDEERAFKRNYKTTKIIDHNSNNSLSKLYQHLRLFCLPALMIGIIMWLFPIGTGGFFACIMISAMFYVIIISSESDNKYYTYIAHLFLVCTWALFIIAGYCINISNH